MVLRETYVDEEVLHSIKKETWAPFEETKFGPSPHMLLPMSYSVGFVNENADHPHAGR